MLASIITKELTQELESTYKFLALVPADQLDWQPHPKSMTMKRLAGHITEICSWFKFCIELDAIDFGLEKWESPTAADGAGFVALAKPMGEESLKVLKATDDDTFLNKRWMMKYNEAVIMDFSKYEAVRHSLSQMIHHRAQLGIYLRLLNIAIPGTYGPSADEMG